MKTKRLALSTVAIFVWVFVSDMIIHGKILGHAYKDTASLWRPEMEMKSYMPFLFVSQLIVSLAVSLLFGMGYAGAGKKGVWRLGAILSGFGIAQALMQYAVSPISQTIAIGWAVAAPVQAIVAVMIGSWVFSKK